MSKETLFTVDGVNYQIKKILNKVSIGNWLGRSKRLKNIMGANVPLEFRKVFHLARAPKDDFKKVELDFFFFLFFF